MDKLGLILSFGSSEGPCLQCPLISCWAAHCWSMTAPQLSVLWAWARTLIHRGGPLKIHPVKVIMPEPWSRDRGPDQWGGGAARRGFQGDAATTDSDPPSAVEKPGESSQVKSQPQPLTEALKRSKWVTKTGYRVINVFLKKNRTRHVFWLWANHRLRWKFETSPNAFSCFVLIFFDKVSFGWLFGICKLSIFWLSA